MDLLAIPFMRHVLFAGVLVALGLAPLSVYVVLRRIVFVGAAVAEISSAGVALAVLLQYEPFAVALVLTCITSRSAPPEWVFKRSASLASCTR